MTDESAAIDRTLQDDPSHLVRRVREVDPTADAEAVQRYAREIAEAVAVLNEIDLHGAPLEASFSPAWKSEQER